MRHHIKCDESLEHWMAYEMGCQSRGIAVNATAIPTKVSDLCSKGEDVDTARYVHDLTSNVEELDVLMQFG